MDFFEMREKRGEQADEESERLAAQTIGAIIEVHRHLGPGHPELIYQTALCDELRLRNIQFVCQAPVKVYYKGVLAGTGKIDVLIENKIFVELKAIEELNKIHKAQTLSYLTAVDLRLGLLVNFNVMLAKDGIKRIVRDHSSPPS